MQINWRLLAAAVQAIGFIIVIFHTDSAPAASQCFIWTEDISEKRGARLKGLLTEKSFAALEDELQARQLKIESGVESDEPLRMDYEAAFQSDANIEPLLTEWIRLYPRSYPARLARARHYVASGYAKRGAKFSSETSEEQRAAMRQEFQKAVVDLNDALQLTKQPTLAYTQLIMVGRASAENNVANLVKYANDNFPKSLATKVAASFALSPKWGGSMEHLDWLITSAEGANMAANQIATLKYRVELAKADHYNVVTKQMARAAVHYLRAAELCENYAAWDGAIRTSYDIEDWTTLIAAADNLLKLYPSHARTFARRGWAYEQTDRMARAIKDYEIAATLGDSWTQNKLGWLLWQGTEVKRDVIKARQLFKRAAAQGNETAQANLVALDAEASANRRK